MDRAHDRLFTGRHRSRRRFLAEVGQAIGTTATVSAGWPVTRLGAAFAQGAQGSTSDERLAPLSADVVVVGGGLAGSTAALVAAQHGARVVLIDKGHFALGDGNTLMAAGAFATGGRLRSNPDALYQEVMSEGVAYPDLAKAFAATCARAVDWITGCGVVVTGPLDGGLRLEPESEISLAPVYRKDTGRKTLAKLRALFEQAGGTTLVGVEGLRLIPENGRVQGVVARRGPDIAELRGPATVLTTGGFSANKELLRQHIGPGAVECKLRGSKSCTGDGLRMALEVGAKVVNLKYFYGHLQSLKALTDDRFWPFPRLDVLVNQGFLVDRTGSRFVDEGRGDVAVSNEVARSPDPTGCALIFDAEIWERARNASFDLPPANPWIEDHDGHLYRRETADELAGVLGIDRFALARSVAQFNGASGGAGFSGIPRTGTTKPLRGPLYGLKVVPGITFTMGGALVNGRAQVLNESEQPIPGLFAAGDAIGGLMGGYRGGYFGGLTQAVVVGILAGENAAAVIRRS